MEESENKRTLIRIIAASVLLVAAIAVDRLVEAPLLVKLCIYLVPYLVAGYDVLLESAENIAHGEIFDENFLMAIATIGALVIGFIPGGGPEFAEAVFVMLFYKVGELLEETAEDKSRDSITKLMDLRPDTATVIRNGNAVSTAPEDVLIGEIVEVKPGEKIPLDGTVVDGQSSVDTVALTGESVPTNVSAGSAVLSSCVNVNGVIRIRVEKAYGESTAAKILELVENSADGKSKSEAFITRFARYYTPIVVISAAALAIIPSIITGDVPTWLNRALSFLVISCPCALVISVPLTFFGGIGCAASRGILIKGSNYIEALSKMGTMVFDKTGTLTEGKFVVSEVDAVSCTDEELLAYAAAVEQFSNHPIATAIVSAYGKTPEAKVSDVEEIAGHGIMASVAGHEIKAGNARLVSAAEMDTVHTGTVVHVSRDGEYLGCIIISDKVKGDSADAVRELKTLGVERVVMLTGDREETAREVAGRLLLDEYHAELLPADKVERVEGLIRSKNPEKSLAFAGDGINDAPVLARADVGIAMGGVGSDAAIEAADVVLMDDKPSKIALAIRIARHTLAIAKENIALAIVVKIAVLILAAIGYAPMWLAVFADVGVMAAAVINAMRALKYSE